MASPAEGLETPAPPARGRAGVTRCRSDPELPEGFHFTVAPGGAAGHRILQRPDRLAAAGAEEGLAVDGDDVEAHVVGAVKGHDGFFSE